MCSRLFNLHLLDFLELIRPHSQTARSSTPARSAIAKVCFCHTAKQLTVNRRRQSEDIQCVRTDGSNPHGADARAVSLSLCGVHPTRKIIHPGICCDTLRRSSLFLLVSIVLKFSSSCFACSFLSFFSFLSSLLRRIG